jgi:ribonuclease P protein component
MKKLYRVRKNEEFSQIISMKHSVANAFFVIYSLDRKQENARVGISVSKKLGNAVERNRIKRQVREMVRALVDFESCPKDMIIIVRKPYVNRAFSDNKNDLEIALKKAII